MLWISSIDRVGRKFKFFTGPLPIFDHIGKPVVGGGRRYFVAAGQQQRSITAVAVGAGGKLTAGDPQFAVLNFYPGFGQTIRPIDDSFEADVGAVILAGVGRNKIAKGCRRGGGRRGPGWWERGVGVGRGRGQGWAGRFGWGGGARVGGGFGWAWGAGRRRRPGGRVGLIRGGNDDDLSGDWRRVSQRHFSRPAGAERIKRDVGLNKDRGVAEHR